MTGRPTYDRRKFGWLNRVMFDITLKPNVRIVAFTIYRHLNDVSGDAWPSQATIARKAGLDIRTVRAAIKRLYVAGYIQIAFDQTSRSNRYEPLYLSSDEPGISTSRPSPMGTSGPSIGTSGPSPMRAYLQNDEGPDALQSNLNKQTKRRNGVRGGVTAALNEMIERFDHEAAEGDGATIEADPISDTWPMVKAAVIGKHGERAKAFMDALSVARDGTDIVLSARGSFHVDTVKRDYHATLIEAWRAEHDWVRNVRVAVGNLRAAE